MKTHVSRHLLVLLICGLLLAVGISPSRAQDPGVTVEAAPIAILTEEAAAPSITCQEGATCVLNEADDTPAAPLADNSFLGLVLVVVGGFVSLIVALSYGLQAIGNRAQAAATNPLEIAVLEKAYESIPQSALDLIVNPLKASLERSDKALQAALDLLNKAGDKVPEASKNPSPYPAATGTPLGTDLTKAKTDTWPTAPGSAGAPGFGSDDFPRTPNRDA